MGGLPCTGEVGVFTGTGARTGDKGSVCIGAAGAFCIGVPGTLIGAATGFVVGDRVGRSVGLVTGAIGALIGLAGIICLMVKFIVIDLPGVPRREKKRYGVTVKS